MFRFRCVNSCLRRLLHQRTVTKDQILEQLQACSAEDEVFELVGKNKAKLTVDHVGCAVGMVWRFQRRKPQMLRTIEHSKNHPQFLTLRVLAENKISLMDDLLLVNTLFSFLRLNVEPHDSLVQQLVSEAWRRLDRLPMESLSKFSVCLHDQHLELSPLMGQITNILDQKMSTIDDPRILTALMLSVSSLVSPRLRNALLSRADHLLDTMDPVKFNSARRVVQFMRNIKYNNRPLLEKCNQILLSNAPRMDPGNIGIVLGLYQSLQYNNCDFRLAAKQRLTELIVSCTDCFSFTELFTVLAPMANAEIRERLENTALLWADEFNALQALFAIEALEHMKCRNLSLIQKVASVIQRNLDVYKPIEVARITHAFALLHYQMPKLFTELRHIVIKFLQRSVLPYEVIMLTRVLSMLPCPRLDENMTLQLEAVMPQCNLSDLNTIAFTIIKSELYGPSHQQSTHPTYARLLQTMNRCGRNRLQAANRLEFLLEELKYATGEWFEEMLLEEMMVTLQRMMDQINWTNLPELSIFLNRIHHLCPPLMDRIASVAIQDIDKIHHSAIHSILIPFAALNYDPPNADELFDVCIQRLTPHISSFDPHLLVYLAFTLSVANRFPEKLVKEIFSIAFLGKLDALLETLPDALNMRTRRHLMKLNRAICLECPEFQVPWFHEGYCLQMQKKGSGPSGEWYISPAQQQICKMLGKVLGGMNYVRTAFVTPYFYTVDFECVLDREHKPFPYTELSTLQILDEGKVHWRSNSQEKVVDDLPPGAQRVAVIFLDSKSFCKRSQHVKGESMMQKRHLEILGYRVVQIPHFELNSMELSTERDWKEYMEKKVFGELSS